MTTYEDTYQYRDYLKSFAYSLTRNYADAEDLVQDTYLRAYACWYQYREDNYMKSWLTTILRNAHTDNHRKASTRPATCELDEWDLTSIRSAEEEALSPVSADLSNVSADMAYALSRMTPQFRAAVVLRDVIGHSYAEIAAQTGVSTATVTSRINRGRDQLRTLLKTPDEDF